MNQLKAALALMRLDKPVGIWLLWWPCAWALWYTSPSPSLSLVVYFALGTLLMRSAGCVVNDIADRHVDGFVARTQSRPLASAQIGLIEAFAILIILLLGALLILLQLPTRCFVDALFAVGITALYPFCKRYIQAPQLVLGVAFSVGIVMVYHAKGLALDIEAYILIILTVIWTVAYDTVYAMVDKEDDLKIGVRSSAILLGAYDKLAVAILLIITHLLWLTIYNPTASTFALVFYVLGALLLGYQVRLVYCNCKLGQFKAFKLNAWYGLMMWLALIAAVKP